LRVGGFESIVTDKNRVHNQGCHVFGKDYTHKESLDEVQLLDDEKYYSTE